jgi:hypothetical protein
LKRDIILKEQGHKIDFIIEQMDAKPTRRLRKKIATTVSRGLGVTNAGSDVRNSLLYNVAKAVSTKRFNTLSELADSIWLKGFSNPAIGKAVRSYSWHTNIKTRKRSCYRKSDIAYGGGLNRLTRLANTAKVAKSKTNDKIAVLEDRISLMMSQKLSQELEIIRLKGMVKQLSSYL